MCKPAPTPAKQRTKEETHVRIWIYFIWTEDFWKKLATVAASGEEDGGQGRETDFSPCASANILTFVLSK